MTNVPTVKAREHLADILNRVAYGKERIALTRRGKPLAAIVPIEDVELLEELGRRTGTQLARAPRLEVDDKGTGPSDRISEDLGL